MLLTNQQNNLQTNDKKEDSEDDETVCVICMDAPKEAAFLHLEDDTAHTCCCMNCANEILNSTKKCPMCRKKVKQVIRNFT